MSTLKAQWLGVAPTQLALVIARSRLLLLLELGASSRAIASQSIMGATEAMLHDARTWQSSVAAINSCIAFTGWIDAGDEHVRKPCQMCVFATLTRMQGLGIAMVFCNDGVSNTIRKGRR